MGKSSTAKKNKKQLLQSLNLTPVRVLLYHNIEDVEYYSQPLSHPDRYARDFSIVRFFRDDQDLRHLAAELLMTSVVSEAGAVNSENSNKNYQILLKTQEKFLDEVAIENLKSYKEDSSFAFDIPDGLFDAMLEFKPDDITVYQEDKNFKYTTDQLKIVLYGTMMITQLFSMYSISMNIDKKVDYFIVELTPEMQMNYFTLMMSDFQHQHKLEEQGFPMFAAWERLEYSITDQIKKNKVVPFEEYLEKINNKEIDSDDIQMEAQTPDALDLSKYIK